MELISENRLLIIIGLQCGLVILSRMIRPLECNYNWHLCLAALVERVLNGVSIRPVKLLKVADSAPMPTYS